MDVAAAFFYAGRGAAIYTYIYLTALVNSE